MKKKLMCLVVLILLLSCGNSSDYMDSFSGTFIRVVDEKIQEGTTTRGNDTVVIAKMGGGETFKVTRSKLLKKVLDNMKQPDEYEVKNWVATFSPSTKTLTVSQTGNIISLDSSMNVLYLGATKFKRIN